MNWRERLGGQAQSFALSPHGFPARLALSQGGFARFRLFHRQAVAVTDPALARQILIQQVSAFQRGRAARVMKLTIGDGLITTDGELWQPARHWLEPAFRRENIVAALPNISSVISEELERWQRISTENAHLVELLPLLQNLIAKLTAQTLFSLNWSDAQLGDFVQHIDVSLNQMARLLRRPWITPAWLPGTLAAQLHSTGQQLDQLLSPLIEDPAHDQGSNHLTQRLGFASTDGQCPLGFRRKLDELKTLAAAAFETSTTTLSWTLDLIARHPDVGQALKHEIDTVVGRTTPDARQLSRLHYCQQVLLESMRLWPAVYNLARETNRPVTLGGQELRPRTVTLVSIYGMHRNPELWQEPDQFKPERFADHAISHPGYLPFAIGPHTCLGKHYAILQMQCLLVMLLQRFELRPVDSQPPDPVAIVTLRPRVSPRLALLPRH